MGVYCDQSHEHAPWGIHRAKAGANKGSWQCTTALECEYPAQLCQAIAEAARAEVQASTGKELPKPNADTAKPTDADVLRQKRASERAALADQPKTSRYPQLIPEYKANVVITAVGARAVQQAQAKLSTKQELGDDNRLGGPKAWPKKAKVLDVSVLSAASGVNGGRSGEGQTATVTLGIQWTQAEFLARAQELEHPFDAGDPTPDHSRIAIHGLLTRGSLEVIERAEEKMAEVEVAIAALAEEEARVHDSIRPEVQSVIHQKKLLILQELLAEIAHPDSKLVTDIAKGMSITGNLEDSGGFFEPKRQPAQHDLAFVKAAAPAVKAKLEARRATADDKESQTDLWAQTIAEREAGLAVGPFTEEQLDAMFSWWVPAPRFPVHQPGKSGP